MKSTIDHIEEDDVHILDIPSTLSKPPGAIRCSKTGPSVPYCLPEPHSKKPFDPGMIDYHNSLLEMIAPAFDRFLTQSRLRTSQHVDVDKQDTTAEDTIQFSLYSENLKIVHSMSTLTQDYVMKLDEVNLETNYPLSDIFAIPVSNTGAEWIKLKVYIDELRVFLIPPNASFLLGIFSESLETFESFSKSDPVQGFDFILLDPPWQNRSAKRLSHAYSYNTTYFDPYNLFKLNLHSSTEGGHLRQHGLVGIWITNNSKWRNFVLDKLLPSWKLHLLARWVWIKITTNGEPLFSMESVTRKPYEILLIAGSDAMTGQHARIPDKVIFAVPEYHSRKPCIKELIEPYLIDSCEDDRDQATKRPLRICEIFGRNLTEGWMTWGDEVLKGNLESCWQFL